MKQEAGNSEKCFGCRFVLVDVADQVSVFNSVALNSIRLFPSGLGCKKTSSALPTSPEESSS